MTVLGTRVAEHRAVIVTAYMPLIASARVFAVVTCIVAASDEDPVLFDLVGDGTYVLSYKSPNLFQWLTVHNPDGNCFTVAQVYSFTYFRHIASFLRAGYDIQVQNNDKDICLLTD